MKLINFSIGHLVRNKPALLCLGNAGLSPNSPIKGYRKCPGTRKLLDALKKRPNCDFLMIDEWMTSQVCALCFERFNGSKKADRFKVCRQCDVKPTAMQATTIVTKTTKRTLQFERRVERRVQRLIARENEMNLDGAAAEAIPNQQRRSLVPNLTRFDKTVMPPRNVGIVNDEDEENAVPSTSTTTNVGRNAENTQRRTIVWQRDISAAKLMIYKGERDKIIENLRY